MRHLKITLLFIFFIFNQYVFGQFSNTSNRLRLWLRADKKVTLEPGNSVKLWENSIKATMPVTGVAQDDPSIRPQLISQGINYNPSISFNGEDQYLVSKNQTGKDLLSKYNITAFFVISQVSGVVNSSFENKTAASQRFGMENSGGKMRFDFPNGSTDTAQGGGQVLTNTDVVGNGFHLLGFSSESPDAAHMLNKVYVNGNLDNKSSLIISPLTNDGYDTTETNIVYCLGKHFHYNLPSECEIAEVIIYKTTLSDADRQKVESYLAYKYGFSLSHPYFSSSGKSLNLQAAYSNDIIGIGRDSLESGLYQKQSMTADSSFKLYIDFLQNTNAENGGIFKREQSFILAGNNKASLNFTETELPAGTNKRINREWEIKDTLFNEKFNLAFTLPASVLQNISSPSKLNFLVDDDGNFVNAKSFKSGSVSEFSINLINNTIYVSGIGSEILDKHGYITIGIDTVEASEQAPVAGFKIASQNNTDVSFADLSLNNPTSWHWNFGDSGESTLQNPTHHYTTAGSYNVCLKVSNSAGTDSLCKSISTNGPSGISRNSNYLFRIYPNPANTILHIDKMESNMNSGKIMIVDMYGRTTLETIANKSPEQSLDISGLSPGIYFIRISNASKSSINSFVVSR